MSGDRQPSVAIFETVEIQNDQNIFSDSDATSLRSTNTSGSQMLGLDVSLDISFSGEALNNESLQAPSGQQDDQTKDQDDD